MTNQVNKEFEKWLKENYPDYPPPLSEVWQSATQAGESKINSLNQRIEYLEKSILKQSSILYDNAKEMTLMQLAIENKDIDISELTASNNQLREAGQALVDRWNTPKWKDAEHTATFIHALEKALSSPPAQSLAEHDNEVIKKLEPCKHKNTIAEWDHVRCEDCGGVHPDSQHGSASHQWFKSWDEVKHYRTTGQRFPETP